IYAALEDYAERYGYGVGFQRRLFAEDAARGFAFIDLCRKRYDIILMNPPFGSATADCEVVTSGYLHSGRDIYGMFVERASQFQCQHAFVGAILPRTGLFIGTMSDLRCEYYLGLNPIKFLVDFGKGVLDGATIRTACFVLGRLPEQSLCLRVGNI